MFPVPEVYLKCVFHKSIGALEFMFCISLLVALPLLTLAQPPNHEITSLPGWDGPLPSKMYSGYLPVGKTSGVKGHIHYWFIESESDPVNDPVVYWTNGGPGGSGITTGLLTEMGAFQLDINSLDNNATNASTIPKLLYNPYTWSKVANTVFVSQPKGVGFSYCDDATTSNECVNNDLTAAEDAYDFFINFFNAYPQYKKNDFYLTAESYGGIYIPMFMDQIQNRGGVPNLKGAAIGDGCWGTKVGLCAFSSGKAQQIQVEFFQGHGMYSQPLYKRIQAACKTFTNEIVLQAPCKDVLAEMTAQIGTFDVYNIFDTCANDELSLHEIRAKMLTQSLVVDDEYGSAHPQLDSSGVGGALNDYACGRNRVSAQWLSLPAVQQALHVNSGTVGMKYNWGPYNVSGMSRRVGVDCFVGYKVRNAPSLSNVCFFFNLFVSPGDLRPLYKQLATKYRMWIYSGDTDACVPYWGTEEWTRELGFDVRHDWHPWKSPIATGGVPQRAGYVVDYNTSTNFKFITVSGAGHMVPTYKPKFALTLFEAFLKDEDL